MRFLNAHILTDNGWTPGALSVDGPLIGGEGTRDIDLTGLCIAPGLIDLHGDGFEHHVAPRRGAMTDLSYGLRATEAELAANGITTAWLAQFWSWEGGMRGPEFAARMARALGDYRAQAIVDMRLQLRVETHMIDDFPVILRLIEETGIEAVVLNDHLPHAAIRAGKRPPRLTGQALKAGRSPEAHHDLIKHLSGRADEVPEALAQFCADLSARGVRIIGSHDDRTSEARDQFRAIGATLAEFPETEEAAFAARDAGDPIVLGAPNVVRGGTHDRGINAAKLFREGACSALVSDYHYPALARGAERLGVAGWHAVTRGPAVIMGATDRGGLGPGMRADLVVLTQDRSAVLGTMVAGRWAYLRAPLTERLM